MTLFSRLNMKLLTFTEARELLGVSAEFLRQSIEKGRIKPVSTGHLTVEQASFDAADVARFGELLLKLKSGGIAAMIDIAASGANGAKD